jgi:ketosteroid isomerase-like protein
MLFPNLSISCTKSLNMKSVFYSLAIIAFLITSCNTATENKQEDTTTSFNLDSIKAAIVSSNQLFADAFVKGDSTLLIDRYASDGCLLPADMHTLCGHQAIATFYRGAYDEMGVRNVKLNTTEVYGEGEYVTEEGTYEIFAAENKFLDKGKFLVLWKKTDTGWKMYRDIFNSDNPPPSQPTAK